jgi:hypothetical protein
MSIEYLPAVVIILYYFLDMSITGVYKRHPRKGVLHLLPASLREASMDDPTQRTPFQGGNLMPKPTVYIPQLPLLAVTALGLAGLLAIGLVISMVR